jgi:hypothetical protein
MTEAEAIMAFREFVGESNQLFMGYISILFAFLIMSYFAAYKLSTVLMIIVASLYSFVAIFFLFQLYFINIDIDNLTVYIYEQKSAGTYDLPWFGHNPLWGSISITVMQALSTVGGYIGSMTFFFYQRAYGADEQQAQQK